MLCCVIILTTRGCVSVVTSQEAEQEHLPLQEAAPGDNGEPGARSRRWPHTSAPCLAWPLTVLTLAINMASLSDRRTGAGSWPARICNTQMQNLSYTYILNPWIFNTCTVDCGTRLFQLIETPTHMRKNKAEKGLVYCAFCKTEVKDDTLLT